jgi:hypothetical protein
MKTKLSVTARALLALFIFGVQLSSLAQGTAFTYQGRLGDGGSAANGSYDLRFTIYDSGTNGSVIAGPLTNASTVVSNGLFTVALDFGAGVFTGPDRWLEIGARTNGAVSFVTLAPRQKVTATPYAVTAGGLSGTVPFAQLPAGILTNNQSGIVLSGTLSGNGAGLTNVNAVTLGGVGANGFWRTAGNAGTTPGANYIGTSDNQPLEIQVNATRALRIEPNGSFAPSLVGGYFQNSVGGHVAAVVAGGGASASTNSVTGDYGFVGAGFGNSAGFVSAVVGGGNNLAPGNYSFIGTGLQNTNGGDLSFIGSGFANFIGTNSPYAVVDGGGYNTIQPGSQTSAIVAGHVNTIQSASFAFIGSGGYHLIQSNAYDSVIVGGGYNTIQTNANGSFIGGGYYHTIASTAATIDGGYNNTIGPGAQGAKIGGGYNNTIQSGDVYSTIVGGINNLIQSNAYENVIVGGHDSVIQPAASFAFIGAGGLHQILSNAYDSAIVAGGYNTIAPNANGSFIGGGYSHTIGTNSGGSFIGGGAINQIGTGSSYTTIGGGDNNGIGSGSGDAVIGGGEYNNIGAGSGDATIAGGYVNGIGTNSAYSTIGGGTFNSIANVEAATIAGGDQNMIEDGAFASIIGAGYWNIVGTNSGAAAVVAGHSNVIDRSSFGFIGAGGFNTIQSNSTDSAILAGGYNLIQTNANGSTIGGGYGNLIWGNSPSSVVGGGSGNYAGGGYSTVPGGQNNRATGSNSFAAGQYAEALDSGSFVWSDATGTFFYSTTSNQFSVRAQGGVRFVTGGAGITVDGAPMLSTGSSILGLAIQQNSSGAPNVIEGSPYNFVGGGIVGATIGGGGATNFSGAAYTNSVTGNFGTVGGGLWNVAGADYATVAGGGYNSATGLAATVAGGAQNTASAQTSTVGGGGNNTASAEGATVSGGYFNTNKGTYATVGGGNQNFASGKDATVSGGLANQATNLYATVPGGFANLAGGIASFAAGQQAQALHQGSFVWADSQNATFASTISNQFNVRAGNGLRVSDGGTNGNIVLQPLGAFGAGYQAINFNGYYDQSLSAEQRFNSNKTRWRMVVDQRGATDLMTIDNFSGAGVTNLVAITTSGSVGIGTNAPSQLLHLVDTPGHGEGMEIDSSINGHSPAIYLNHTGAGGHNFRIASYGDATGSSFRIRDDTPGFNADRFFIDTNGNVGIGTITPTNKLHVAGGVSATAFVSTSDRNAKENFRPVSPQAVLDKVASLPISTWNFKDLHDGRHMGPMAQDFYAAFGLGGSDTTITTVDPDGVALAAIQGLNQKVEDGSRRSEDRIQRLQQKLDQKETEITDLKQRLAKLEQLMNERIGGAQ